MWTGLWLRVFSRWSGSDRVGEEQVLSSLSEGTRRFVSTLRVPGKDGGVVYLLAAEGLSERSALDAFELVSVAKPAAVVAQVSTGSLTGLRAEEDDCLKAKLPTSFFGVIRDCFLDSTQRAGYEGRATIEVIRTIFGTTFHGHILSARDAALQEKSSFSYFENPSIRSNEASTVGVRASSFYQRLSLFQPAFSEGIEDSKVMGCPDDCPTYAQPFYHLLVELQEAYQHLPGMAQALRHTRKLLVDVEQGRPVDENELVEAQKFRLAVEGLRISLNSAANQQKNIPPKPRWRRKQSLPTQFEKLSADAQCHVLLAEALREQARKHGSVVAVVDASSVCGIVGQWNTSVSNEVSMLAGECLRGENLEENLQEGENGVDNKCVAAAVGIAATPLVKSTAAAMPAFAKVSLVQVKRNAVMMMSRSEVWGMMVKAGKARAAARSVVASAERAAFSGVRTALYCLMRKKQGMSASGGGRPWLMLGASVLTGVAVVQCRDRIESAIECAPAAGSVARLGRGLQHLQQTMDSLRRSSSSPSSPSSSSPSSSSASLVAAAAAAESLRAS